MVSENITTAEIFENGRIKALIDQIDLEEEEKASIRAYLHCPAALHTRRTLDQYYYHMIDTKRRDQDQVVSRWANSHNRGTYNILMVYQLWLWNTRLTRLQKTAESESSDIIPCFIVSSFPERSGTESQATHFDDLRKMVLEPDQGIRGPIRCADDLTNRILETCFSTLDKFQVHKSLRFVQIFEESIGSIVRQPTQFPELH